MFRERELSEIVNSLLPTPSRQHNRRTLPHCIPCEKPTHCKDINFAVVSCEYNMYTYPTSLSFFSFSWRPMYIHDMTWRLPALNWLWTCLTVQVTLLQIIPKQNKNITKQEKGMSPEGRSVWVYGLSTLKWWIDGWRMDGWTNGRIDIVPII